MRDQLDLLDQIVQVVYDSCDEEWDEITLEVDVTIEGGRHLRYTIWQVINGKKHFPDFHVSDDLMDLSFDLHKAMKEHTGGDMKRYTVKIDGEGVVKTSFEYRNEPSKQGETQ